METIKFNPYAYRDLFPITQESIYVNHAALSPFSTKVTDNVQRYLDIVQKGDTQEYDKLLREMSRLKSELGTLLNSSADRISFVPNTSNGLIIAATGLDWKAGDHILLNSSEFPANIYPFLKLKEKGVIVDFLTPVDGKITSEMVAEKLTSKTRMLSLSFVQFLNGYKADLKSISTLCREKGVYFVVDAIQGLGAFSLDVMETDIDFLSCGGHKWMMGPQGIGFIYVKEAFQNILNPPMSGWLSVERPFDFFNLEQPFKKTADKFLTGTLSVFGIYGLSASVNLINKAISEGSMQHIISLGDLLVEALSSLGFIINSPRGKYISSGIISVKYESEEKSEALFQFLNSKKVFSAYRSGFIRFAPHFYNTAEEMMQIVDLCEEFIGQSK